MKNPLPTISILIALLVIPISAKSQTRQFNSDKVNCTYETYKGRIHGKYISYYPNGIKKAEGKFENNYRSGKWKLWDSSGNLMVVREYFSPLEYSSFAPNAEENTPPLHTSKSVYTILYNSENFIIDYTLHKEMIIWEKRIWRWIPVENNEMLFENNALFNTIHNNVMQGNIIAYSSTDDLFTRKLNTSEIDTANVNIIGFKIKEDHTFDKPRLLSETRIIGICPVALNKITKDTIDLYWIQFPEARKYLSRINVVKKEGHPVIFSLDEVFFYRIFNSVIYKEDNIYNRKISDYKTGADIQKESEKIEINLIEMEHDLWFTEF